MGNVCVMFKVAFKLIVGVIVAAVVSLGLLQGLEYSGYPAMSAFEELTKDWIQDLEEEECQRECGELK